MRKWLVGLLAAGLCAASAWAATDTLDLAFTGVSGSYTEWSEKTGDSGAVYAGQSASGTKDNPCIQLRSNNNNSGIVTTGSGGTATKVTVVWNSETADARILDVYGKNEAYTAATDLYSKDAQGTKLGSLNKGNGDTELVIDGEYTFIGLRSNSGAMYLDSVAIEWGGEPTPVEFSIALKPAEDFEVVQNKSASITATVKGAKGDVTYSWSVDGTPIDLAGNVYAVDSAEVGGPFEVVCEADDGVSDPVSASVKYTVVEAPVVTGDVLTRDTTGVTGTSYKDWTATGDSGTKFAGNSAGGNDSIQLNTGSPKGIVITESAGSDVASVTVEWNDATAEKRSIEIYGSADAYAGPADLYGDAKGELLGTLAKGETTLAVPEGYPYVGILAKGGALYLTSVAFEFAGEAGLSVTLDKANGFTVDLGTADSITATAKNGVEPYTYVWTSDTPDLNGTGETLAIPATLAEDDYTVQVEVTDAESNKASKQIGFSVVAPAVKYQVQVAIGIPNGSVSADKTEAEEGELVTLTASPATGYKLEHFLVNNVAISANTFPMPAEDVLVSASFIEKPVVAGFTKITSLDDLTEGEYVITGAGSDGEYAMKASISTGSTKFIERREEAVTIEEDTVTDAEDIIIWTLAQGANGWTIYNADVGYAGYVASGNSAGAEAEASEKSSWTIAESETDGLFLLTNVGNTGRYLLYNASSPRFACYEKTTSGKQLALYKGSSGPAVFSITLDPAKDFEVEQNAEAFVTAIPKHAAEGVVGYAWWIDGTPVDTAGEVLALATAELGPHKVICEATDAAGAKADAHVIYTVVAPAVKYAVNVAIGILNGTVTTDVSEAAEGDPVTVTATPADGYRLVEIIVNNGDVAVSGNTFVMPAQDVLVTATFEEFEVPPYYFQFETGKPAANSYKDTDADVVNTGSTSDTVPTVNFTLQRAGRGGDEKDKFVGTYALRMGPTNEVPAFFYNTEAFSEDITAISFQYGIYGTDKCESFTVSTSADGADWTQLADLTADASADGLKTYTNDELPAGVRFIRFDATSTQKSNIRRINIDEIQLWTGAPSPKIVYSGETTIALGGTFEIIFGLLNYEGDFEWVLDSREGGSIAPDGLYTWEPTEAIDEVTIKVVARSGELDIATKEVVLTVTEPGPQPGEPAIVFGGDTEGTVGTPVNFTVASVSVTSDPTVYPDGFVAPDGSTLTDEKIDYGEEGASREVSFTPDVPGEYVFTFVAGQEGAADEVRDSVTITVAGAGPQPGGFQITGLAKTGDNLVLTFAGEGTPAVLGTTSLAKPQEWTPVEGATVSGTTATVPMGAQNYIRLQ